MNVSEMLPEIYYRDSRDFSFVGRLFEIVFNYMKTGADSISANISSEYIDANIIDLAARTLGFESKHKYTSRDLIFIINSFSELLKIKGTKASVEMAVQLLLNSQKINQKFHVILKRDKNNKLMSEIEIQVPEEMNDIILLEDLFDYILPAGIIYKISKAVGGNTPMKTDINLPESKISFYKDAENKTSQIYTGETIRETITPIESGNSEVAYDVKNKNTIPQDWLLGDVAAGTIYGPIPDTEEQEKK